MRKMIIAALLAATPALAQEPPTTVGLGSSIGAFEAAGDRDTYRIKLAKGLDYAFGAQVGPGDGTFTVKTPTGTTVCAFLAGGSESDGCEFRAGSEGYFTVVAQEEQAQDGYPLTYLWKLQKDCRDDDRTRCRLTPRNSTSVPLAYGLDVDWIKLALLTKGRSYTATLTLPAGGSIRANLTVRTAAGEVPSPGGTFKATGGTMFLVVAGSEFQSDGQNYKVSLR